MYRKDWYETRCIIDGYINIIRKKINPSTCQSHLYQTKNKQLINSNEKFYLSSCRKIKNKEKIFRPDNGIVDDRSYLKEMIVVLLRLKENFVYF